MHALLRRWHGTSLRTQLLVSLTLAAALLLLILAWWTSSQGRAVVERCRGLLLQNSASHLADKMSAGLQQRSREIGLIASLPQLRDPDAPAADKRRLLDELKRAYPLYAWIGLTDLQGTIIAGSEGLLEGKTVAKRAWFLEGLQGPHVGDVHDAVLLSKIMPKPQLDPLPLRLADISAPVRDAQGKVVGVICGHLSWDWSYMVRDTLAKGTGFGHGNHIDIFVLNKLGNILVGTPNVPPSARVLDFESVQLAMLGDAGSRVEVWPDGQRYVTAYAQARSLEGYPGADWIILAREPVQEAYRVADQLSQAILLTSAGAFGLFLLLLTLQVRRVTAPLERIAGHAQAIASGASIQSLPEGYGTREIDRLTGALNTMLGSLDTQRTELEMAAKVFEHSHEGFIITDAQTRILKVNPAFVQITGLQPHECIGLRPSCLQSGRHDAEFYTRLWTSVQNTGQWSGEIWNRRKNGQVYPEWLAISAVCDGQGKVTHYIGVFTDITERKAQEERIAHLAHHDALTDLPNRVLLHDRLSIALEHSRERRSRLAVLFIDLDMFKHINDTLGHIQGDQLLVQVAQRLRDLTPSIDTVARMGGDEFVMLMRGEAGDVSRRAQAILSALLAPFEVAGRSIHITTSIGISLYPEDADNPDDLLRHADVALYQAKQSRNAFRFHTESMTRHAEERLRLEQALREALEQEQFQLAYQPQLNLRDGTVIGAEALIRWRHPELGPIPPGRFIPLAEEIGLIPAIGEWVLRTACHQMQTWRERYGVTWRVAVNLSIAQLERADFVNMLDDALHASGLPVEALEIEVTESMMMTDNPMVRGNLDKIRGKGIKIALDDFGTGYSNLGYLADMPLDILKIDKRFVDTITQSGKGDAVARLIIQMTGELGFATLAEGVEHAEQAEALTRLGCDYVQGYHFARPLPPEEIETRYLATS
ncbi:MAG: EAL domain-containing protein [Halothiobacillaceae bacterium]|nr:MAG: EAL domain-containing protein [Halothiobacillaceae bacterium]